ncbi:sulfite exporter TauE/SafE family protein [Paraclostridium bifermentans]|uniref:sulfite exporter TauE/SafE family protein n=1 Tax=Paraclostridium bifermentans TaxID=1490 RepID=UPI00359C781B
MSSILVFIISGILAGIGIGLVGLSAASIITPILVAILGFDAYKAIGIALSADVLAAGVSSITYFKNKNIDIKNGIVMMISTMIFTYIFSYFAKFIPSDALGSSSIIMTILLGLKFLTKPINGKKSSKIVQNNKSKQIFLSILWGSLVGIVCGVLGAGGGVMLLLVLTSVLNYDLKTAVGTSVFIMAFTAFTGAFAHIIHGGTNVVALLICSLSALASSRIAAVFANKTNNKTLNKVTGIFLMLFGVVLLGIKFIK